MDTANQYRPDPPRNAFFQKTRLTILGGVPYKPDIDGVAADIAAIAFASPDEP
jgi:hypothetical protein